MHEGKHPVISSTGGAPYAHRHGGSETLLVLEIRHHGDGRFLGRSHGNALHLEIRDIIRVLLVLNIDYLAVPGYLLEGTQGGNHRERFPYALPHAFRDGGVVEINSQVFIRVPFQRKEKGLQGEDGPLEVTAQVLHCPLILFIREVKHGQPVLREVGLAVLCLGRREAQVVRVDYRLVRGEGPGRDAVVGRGEIDYIPHRRKGRRTTGAQAVPRFRDGILRDREGVQPSVSVVVAQQEVGKGHLRPALAVGQRVEETAQASEEGHLVPFHLAALPGHAIQPEVAALQHLVPLVPYLEGCLGSGGEARLRRGAVYAPGVAEDTGIGIRAGERYLLRVGVLYRAGGLQLREGVVHQHQPLVGNIRQGAADIELYLPSHTLTALSVPGPVRPQSCTRSSLPRWSGRPYARSSCPSALRRDRGPFPGRAG